jgi:hypothetical protein
MIIFVRQIILNKDSKEKLRIDLTKTLGFALVKSAVGFSGKLRSKDSELTVKTFVISPKITPESVSASYLGMLSNVLEFFRS